MPRNGNGPRQSFNRNKKSKAPHKTVYQSKPILHQYGKKTKKPKKETAPNLNPINPIEQIATMTTMTMLATLSRI